MLLSPLGEGVVNLLCSLVGARYLGALGVALGTLVGACVGVLLHFTNSMPRTDEMKFARWELGVTGILKPILSCLPTFLIVFLLASHISSPFTLAILISGGELLAFLFLWRVNFDTRERNEIVSLVLRFAYSWHRRRIERAIPS